MEERSKLIGGRFRKIKRIGRGGFGDVFLAFDENKKENVALKKIRVRITRNGLDYNALQEIRQLNEMSHENIVKFGGVFLKPKSYEGAPPSVFLSLELLKYNLVDLISSGLSIDNIKYVVKAWLEGLNYMHKNGLIHRDVKPDNVMFTNDGILRLIDFGLSCDYPSESGPMITQATTLPYRAPELMFGCDDYGPEVDMWSLGVSLCELFTKKPVFDADNDVYMLKKIAEVFGGIEWDGCQKLRAYVKFRVPQNFEAGRLNKTLEEAGAPKEAIDLILKMMTLDPKKRITAEDALKHEFLADAPKSLSL